jgi:hypothetical protein
VVAENEIVAGNNTCPGSVVKVKPLLLMALTVTATVCVCVGKKGRNIVLTSVIFMVDPRETFPLNCICAAAAGAPPGPNVPE